MRKNLFNFMFSFSAILALLLGCSESAKKPRWQKAKILAENVDHPAAVTADENFIYYVTGGTIASLNEGTSGVWKMPVTGGAPVQLFKGHKIDENKVILPEAFVLATDEKYVYWSSGSIWRTPKAGGESQEISGGMPTEWAFDETRLYWHNFGGENSPPTPIYAVDKKGGAAAALTEPVITSGIVLDKEFLVWAQSDGIYRIAKTGGEKTRIYSAPEKQAISGLTADANNFYFTEGNGRNALMKLGKQGGKAVKLAPEINHVHKFYADGNYVYFIKNEGSFDNSLNKVAISGGEIVQIDSGYPASFAVGANKIFVTDISNIYALEK